MGNVLMVLVRKKVEVVMVCVDDVEEEGGSGYGRGVVLMSVRKRVVMVMGEGLN